MFLLLDIDLQESLYCISCMIATRACMYEMGGAARQEINIVTLTTHSNTQEVIND